MMDLFGYDIDEMKNEGVVGPLLRLRMFSVISISYELID